MLDGVMHWISTFVSWVPGNGIMVRGHEVSTMLLVTMVHVAHGLNSALLTVVGPELSALSGAVWQVCS